MPRRKPVPPELAERDRIKNRDRARKKRADLKTDPVAYAAHQVRNRDFAREWRKNNHERHRQSVTAWDLKKKFGLTYAAYSSMLAAQDGACAICRKAYKRRRLGVDHDHVTGAVRALLCDRCNMGIGQFRDDPALLFKAARYLTRHRQQSLWR